MPTGHANLPDGSAVRLGATLADRGWCDCAKLKPAAAAGVWSPVVITVPMVAPRTSLRSASANSLRLARIPCPRRW